MIPLLLAARELGRAIAAVWRDPETKALPVVAGALVLTGTLFYWRFEDWTIIEALYFSIVTLTTVGYGDFAPTSAGTQIFTIVYILTGFGVLVALLTSVAEKYLELKGERAPARASVSARRDAASRPTEEDADRRRAEGRPRSWRAALAGAVTAALLVELGDLDRDVEGVSDLARRGRDSCRADDRCDRGQHAADSARGRGRSRSRPGVP